MEIWSRLVGGASPGKKPAANSPQQRLIRFKKVHDQLQLIWRRNNVSSKDISPPEPVFHCLQNIRQILQNESQTTAPQLCARHVSTFHIYSTIAQLAAIYPDEGIIQEALDIFKILLESEEGDFLKDKGFADALIGFISTVSASVLPIDLEARTVEVLFGISAKLRLQPELLSAWFRPGKKGWALPSETTQKHMDKEEFPLFYLTLDYVHHDGRAGDFARTGLLYLIESAAHSAALEQWIIESDLATLMASGLGALYSQLSRKLVIVFEEEIQPLNASLSEGTRPKGLPDAEMTTSPDFKAHLTTFLSYLVFWQDVLEHCSSSDVKQTLLDHFKYLFLQQLLYPSLIESSDRDGGSSVAVLTYLKCIIESIDHPDLVQLTFEYLLAIPEPKLEEKSPSRPMTLARRRRSQSLLASLAQGQAKPLPDLFNLDDLVLSSLRSSNQQTVNATLRLISTMLRTHHRYDVSLIKTRQPDTLMSFRSLEAHERNTALLFSIVEEIMDDPTLKESYEIHLEDAQTLLESHACTVQLLTLPSTEGTQRVSRSREAASATLSAVAFDDPILRSLVALLEDFLANEIETNLSLSYTFATIASCARRQLDGWLLEASIEYNNTTTIEEDDALPRSPTTHDHDIDDTLTTVYHPRDGHRDDQQSQSTPVFAALDSLIKQVETFRNDIADFDIHLAERRHILKADEHNEKSHLQDTPAKRRSEDSARSNGPPKKNPQIGSISERLLSESSTANRSRSASPRGRQPDPSSAPTLVGRLSHLRHSPSRSPSKSASRAISPSPLRNDIRSDMLPEEAGSPAAPALPSDPLQQKVRIKLHRFSGEKDLSDTRSETSSVRSDSVINEPSGEQWREVTLSQILTNVIILQEFVLELVAIVQVRASLFGEVSFG